MPPWGKRRTMKFIRCIFLCFIVTVCWCFGAFAQLAINFIAVNPSETEAREIEVQYFLPQELEPDDVLDVGPLKLEFDVERNSMYVFGKIKFAPKESRTFRVRVNDVWKIDPAEINLLKEQLDKTLALLKEQGHEKYDDSVYVRDQLNRKMDFILKRQQDFSGNVERRIEEYRANITTL